MDKKTTPTPKATALPATRRTGVRAGAPAPVSSISCWPLGYSCNETGSN